MTMRVLTAHDDDQLRRVTAALTRLEQRPPAEQRRLACLIEALRREAASLRHPGRRLAKSPVAAAA